MSEDGVRWFAVIDTAQDERLHPLVQQCREHQCLVGGTPAPELAATLPWLVAFDAAEPLGQLWRAEGFGRGWGILLTSALSLDGLRQQLKKLLTVKLPDGRLVWCRFYDPQVLQSLLRASSPEEQAPWFRGIDRFVAEADDRSGHWHIGFADGQIRAELAR